MAETTVTFLTYDTTTQVYTPEVRVFDLEISADAQTYYLTCIRKLQDLMAQPTPDMTEISHILSILNTWSKYMYVYQGNQVTLSSTSIDDITSTSGGTIALSSLGSMDRYMASDVDKLIRTVRAAGYDPISQNFTKSGLTLSDVSNKLFVTDVSLYDVAGTLTDAINSASQCRISTNVWTQSESIQQLLMVDYVSRGNELLFNQMSELKTAIDLNQSTLAYLNSLQDLMNQKDPQHFIMALQNLSGAVGGDTSLYSAFEEQSFNQELSNVAKFTDSDISSYLRNILGLDPTATPTASQTQGTALGSFQNLSATFLANTLNAYLSSQSSSATMAALLPDYSTYPEYAQALSDFATLYSLSSSDKQLVWQAFLVQEAGSELPSVVDPKSTIIQADFQPFLDSLGSITSSSVAQALQAKLQQSISTSTNLLNALLSDAGVSDLSGLSSLDATNTANLPAIKAIIDSFFTGTLTLSDTDKENIVKAFVMKQMAAESVPSVDVLSTTSTYAFKSYLAELSDKTTIMPVAWTTALPTISVNTYANLLNSKFSTDAGYTDADRLAIWKGFLMIKGLTTDTSFLPGISATTYEFSDYLDTLTPLLSGKTGGPLEYRIYSYLQEQASGVTFNTTYTSEQTIDGMPFNIGSGQYTTNSTVDGLINSSINTLLSSLSSYPTISPADKINIWKSYLLYAGKTVNEITFLNFNLVHASNFNAYLTALNTDIESTDPDMTGASLVNFLNTYAFFPHPAGLSNANYAEQLRSEISLCLDPTPPTTEISLSDALILWKGYMLYTGITKADYYEMATPLPFPSDFSAYLLQIKQYSAEGSSGEALLNATDKVLYLKTHTVSMDSLTSVTKAPATTTLSDLMATTLNTTSLTDNQKFQIWYAFLASQAKTNSIMTQDITSAATLSKFTAFLTDISTDDIGNAIDERMQRIISNLQYLIDKIAGVADASPLQSQLTTLLSDFQTLQADNRPLSTWVEDYQSGNIGGYQKHLNDTIVSAQALNDTQREELRRVMFVYEEFYKSATAMLSSLDQLIAKMAAAISR